MLTAGLIVLYHGVLHKVEYVNSSRAYLVPVSTRKRKRPPKGVSIAPTVVLPIVKDGEPIPVLTEPAESGTPKPRRLDRPGWVAKDAPDYRPGSLNDRVLSYILLHPRQRTPQIVAALKHDERRNIVACIRRLYTSGVIVKE